MSQINGIINTTFGQTGSLRAMESQQNTKVNGLLLDITFTPTDEYMNGDKFAVYKKIFVDLNLRSGGGNGSSGSNELLIDSVSLYQLLQYSDMVAGVSVKATAADEMKAGSPFRISGYVDLGFFPLGERDSLDIELYCSEQMPFDVNINASTVFQRDSLALLRKYQTSKPTGSDQSYQNIIGIYVDTDKILNKSITIRDMTNDMTATNIEDAIALTNACANFEVFTRFGEVWADPYGVSQNITMKVPTDNEDTEILLVGYVFNTQFLASSAGNFVANKELLLTKIRNEGGTKVDYLTAMGIL